VRARAAGGGAAARAAAVGAGLPGEGGRCAGLELRVGTQPLDAEEHLP
jgi:hypothetical protein